MITEDYVSFEVAKLLKEKGFDEICFTWYTGKGEFEQGENNFDDYFQNHHSKLSLIDTEKCSAPTLQRACKWLREVHNIYIAVNLFYPGKYIHYTPLYYVGIFNTLTVDDLIKEGCPLVTDSSLSPREYTTPEEAYEEAIKYCLENLI